MLTRFSPMPALGLGDGPDPAFTTFGPVKRLRTSSLLPGACTIPSPIIMILSTRDKMFILCVIKTMVVPAALNL